MKLWQRTLALIMGISMAFPLSACGDGTQGSSSSSETSSATSSEDVISSEDATSSEEATSQEPGTSSEEATSQEPGTSSEEATSTNKEIANLLVSSLKDQIQQAKTISISASGEQKIVYSLWLDEEDTEPTTFYDESKTTVNATLSVTETSVNAKVLLNVQSRESETDAFDQTNIAFYFIDGIAYSNANAPTENTYYKYEYTINPEVMETVESTTLMLEEICAFISENVDIQLPTIRFNDTLLVKAISSLVAESFTFDQSSVSLSYDYKPVWDTLQTYASEIDLENTTVREQLDKILTAIDENLNTALLVNELESLANVNAQEALNSIDSWLTENYETTLQGIFDAITDSQTFTTLFGYIAPSYGMNDIQADEMLANIQAWDLATYLSQIDGFSEMSLYDVVMSACSYYNSEMPTLEDIKTMVNSTLDMPLANVSPVFVSNALATINQSTVSAFNETLRVGFDSEYTVNDFSFEQNVNAVMNVPAYTDKTDTYSIVYKTEESFNLSPLSIPVALPDNAIIEDGI